MTVIIRNSTQYAEAKEQLKLLKTAREKILGGGQSYQIGPNRMERANLKEISEEISAYETAIDAYETKGTTARRAKRVVPIG
jgi:uncharacterized protein Yka (UPF0111/DUF47 family)